jgi:Methyltransferase domain
MRLYDEYILPRLTDLAGRDSELAQIRIRAAGDLAGEVLEIGFGSGLNVPHYPTAVVRVLAVDPATVGRKLAAKRVAASFVPVEYVGPDPQTLPLDSASVDHVLSTWTLCTIPDLDRAPWRKFIACSARVAPCTSPSMACPPAQRSPSGRNG